MMRPTIRFPALLTLTLVLAAAPRPARADAPGLRLVYGAKVVTLTAEDIAALPHQTITTVDGHDHKSHAYSGIPVRDLLARVGVSYGDKMKGGQLRLAVIVRSSDGYVITYAAAEFDAAYRPTTILLVDGEDGAKESPNVGPFRLVAPGDTRPARWARMVTSLEVVALGDAK
jgi:hypothetical protein